MALSGSLDVFSISEVLRLLAGSAKTGRLTLGGDRGTGELWIRDGLLVRGRADAVVSSEIDVIVLDLLRFRHGSFDFMTEDVVDVDVDDEGARSVDDALAAAEEMLVMWREIETVLPSLDVHVRTVAEVTDDVILTPAQWRVVARLGAGTSARALVGQLGTDEFTVGRELHTLIEAGLVEVDEAGTLAEAESRRTLPAFEVPGFAAGLSEPDWEPSEAVAAQVEPAHDVLTAPVSVVDDGETDGEESTPDHVAADAGLDDSASHDTGWHDTGSDDTGSHDTGLDDAGVIGDGTANGEDPGADVSLLSRFLMSRD